MYFESHAHYDDARYNEDRDEVLPKMHKEGIDYVVNVGADMASSLASIKLSQKYDFVYASVGVHPHEAKEMQDKDFETLKEYCKNEKVVAIGEIGLDFYYDHSPRDIQRQIFTKQLNLCEIVTKPVIIHSREAAQECFDIIKESKVRKGVIHAFAGSAEMANEYIKMGFYIGVGGVVTFKNARKLVEVVEAIPLESILIETDAPYLSPMPLRGTRNISQNLSYITEKIAQIKQISVQKVAETTRKNALSLFDTK